MPKDAKIKTSTIELTESMQVLKNATTLKIDFNLIRILHYLDFQNLIVALKIDDVSQILSQLRKNQLNKKGIAEVVEASSEDYKNL